MSLRRRIAKLPKDFYTLVYYIQVMSDKQTLDLEPGDFLYQSDQELFLVVMEEREDSYLLAAHGWRNIDKDRLEEYLDVERSKLYEQSSIEKLIEKEADADEQESFEQLHQIFQQYDSDMEDSGPHEDFALEDN
jgi:hypothetical protein